VIEFSTVFLIDTILRIDRIGKILYFMWKRKKIIIFLIIISLLIIAGGVFWWWQGREIKGSPEDYVIKETAEGKIVENKKAGLKVKVPEGWETKRIEMEEGAVAFYSSDMESDWKEGKIVLPLRNGCRIQVGIGYEHVDFTDLKIELRYSYALMGMKSVSFEETTVKKYPALKSIFDIQERGSGVGVSISIPMDNKVYGFSVVWGPDEKETCVQEFNKFLETISIE